MTDPEIIADGYADAIKQVWATFYAMTVTAQTPQEKQQAELRFSKRHHHSAGDTRSSACNPCLSGRFWLLEKAASVDTRQIRGRRLNCCSCRLSAL